MTRFVDTPDNRSMLAATVIPVLHYADAPAAAQWLCEAFGFVERLRIGEHRVQLLAGAAGIVVARADGDDRPARQTVMVRVADVDAHHRQAAAHGATVLNAPASHPFGERQYSAEDPGGHVWTFSQTEADVDPADWGGRLTG